MSIAYQVIGEGSQDLIIIPGFAWHIEHLWIDPGYHRLMRGLSDFARVVAYDKRGTGMSDPVSSAPSLDERMDDVIAVLDAVGSERATIVGVSEGGPIGAIFAASHPERVERLIIYGAFVCRPDRADAPGSARSVDRWKNAETLADHWGEGRLVELFAPSVDTPTMRRAAGLLERVSMSPAMARANTAANWNIDIRPVLSSIRVPTLVLHRREDSVPIEHGHYYVENIDGARMVELDGEDHWPFVGDIDAIVGEIEEFVTGARASHESDTLLATVLFTDIVGSTERAAELGDSRWRALLLEHDELVRRQVAAHDGHEIKHLGDGFLCVFDRPTRAVRCATRIIADAAEFGVHIRAGLHTGECERRGADITGLTVHIGARIGALAGSGEVLVSGTVRDLVLGSGIKFDERGQHSLKGVPGNWHLFAVADVATASPIWDNLATPSKADRAFLAAGRRAPLLSHALARVAQASARRRRRPTAP
ncbi:adenylate/guanylate cyclase domain-containing protein [Mycobacterium sp. 1164985.4]|uniref:adenylate/guanylate cyclase domain-containing protein n=1 Tax=Mycobacterium sp. 1164985.4 TaxID=1834069 RepID=UPI0018D3EF2B|nr:adenylate/guanylate cyclase domain-containing protein [Mycobacterium sp. 1164985.4]